VIRGMTELLDQSLGPEVTLRIAQGAGIGAAFADPNQLELAILNLAINARDAMPEGGTLSISTAEREVPPGDPSLAPGTYVVVDVADTGGGMPPDILAQAFDPFFTTKPAGKGTGLGLSQVYGIAKQSGGEARIVSAPCKGTTVSLWLRRATDQPIRAGDSAKGTHGAPQSERILLVDDDPDVSQVVHEFLVDLGYEVRVANHGAAALEIIQAFAADLAIIDFAMPGGNGADVAKAVRQWRPALPILFMSGYADTKGLEGAVGEAPLLHKPFRPAELAASVRNALGSRIEVPPAASAGED